MGRILLVLAASVALLTGCYVSDSLETISDSVSSPFEWSSDSSGSSSEDSEYRQDVSRYTLAYASRGGDLEAFREGLGRLAAARGVSDWEEDAATCASIGAGLRLARLDRAAAEAFGSDLFGANTDGRARLLAGYASVP